MSGTLETPLVDAVLTVAEAAFVTGHSIRSVHHEIDGDIVEARSGPADRLIGGADLLYLGAIRSLRTDLGPAFRRRLRTAIHDAARARSQAARVEHFSIALDAVANDLAGNLRALRRLRHEQIETRPDILAGEPVLKGTRMPALHVADMRRQGATAAVIMDEFDLTAEQVEAAELFARVSPRQGRPPRSKAGGDRVPAA